MKNLFQLLGGIRNPQQFLQSMMNNSQVMGNPMPVPAYNVPAPYPYSGYGNGCGCGC